ncbi:MAG: amidase [Nitrososphaerota archaeon]|nr:amidase [Aigarchaeota archaeon]MDW8077042.1 amidase [Nitrososphaerota archaeon]
MRKREILHLSIKEISEAIRTGEISPVELVMSVVERIKHLNPLLNAYISVFEQSVVDEASKAEAEIRAGRWLGPLHGVPLSIKDVFYLKDVKMTAGSPILKDFIARHDATVVRKLREAGAIFVGKTNLHEFAYGVTNVNPHFGATRNPWNLNRIAGGSSGGSAAAVAAGMCFASLGTDTGGSTRIPASLCGIVGFKPTYGLVSKYGVFPLAWSLDHVGILARSAWDVGILLETIAGYDPLDSTTLISKPFEVKQIDNYNVKRLRIGVPSSSFLEPLQEDVKRLFWNSLKKLEDEGWQVHEFDFKHFEHVSACRYIILLTEAASLHAGWLKKNPELYSDELRHRLMLGLLVPPDVYLKAQRARKVLLKEFLRAMKDLDLIACPTTSIIAPMIGEEKILVNGVELSVRLALLRLTEPFNALALPAISVPCGISEDGLPVGLQMVAKPFHDGLLLAAALAYEEITGNRYRIPPL